MKLLSVFTLWLIVFSECPGQGTINITGRIVDAKDGTPLILAAISVKEKGIGTVSNGEGEFEFHVPENYANDTLQISMVGYATNYSVINAMERDKPITITLRESPVILKEAIVVASSLTANEIFKRAFENLEKTFPQEGYLLKGFYRQINTENGKNVLLVEASIDIFDKRTQLNNNFNLREKIFLNQIRLSNSLFKNTDPNYFEKSNTLSWLLLFNYTKYRNKYVMERTNFTLDSIVSFNQRSFYVISSTVKPIVLTNKFTLYVDVEDFSFLKIKNETVANRGYYVQNFDVFTDKEKKKILKLTATSQTYQFERYKNAMFLKHAHSYSEGEIIDVKTKAVEWKVTDENLLVINEVTTDHVKTPGSQLMDNRKNIKFLAGRYDEKFWNNFALVNLIPLTKKERSDLGEVVLLEDQFKNQIIRK